MDRGAWWATVYRVTQSWTRLSDLHFHFHTWLLVRLNPHHNLPRFCVYKIQKAEKAMDLESKTSSQLVLQQLSCLLWQRTQSDMCLNCVTRFKL